MESLRVNCQLKCPKFLKSNINYGLKNSYFDFRFTNKNGFCQYCQLNQIQYFEIHTSESSMTFCEHCYCEYIKDKTAKTNYQNKNHSLTTPGAFKSENIAI